MQSQHPDAQRLIALAEARAEAGEAASLRAHLQACADCRQAAAGLEAVGAALGEMARAERSAASAGVWPGVQARLQRPGIAARLPLELAAAWRLAAEFARPAMAASAIAMIAGLGLGTWMGVLVQRAPADAQALEAYAASSLVQESESGVTESYLSVLDASADLNGGSGGDDSARARGESIPDASDRSTGEQP